MADWWSTKGPLPAARSPRIPDDPPREGSRVRHGLATSVYTQFERLAALWKNDDDRLALLLAVWTLAGYPAFNFDYVPEKRIRSVLYRRNRAKLRHQAEGALMVLEALAQDAEEMDLLRRQMESHVVECRELSLDERINRLRREDRARQGDEAHVG